MPWPGRCFGESIHSLALRACTRPLRTARYKLEAPASEFPGNHRPIFNRSGVSHDGPGKILPQYLGTNWARSWYLGLCSHWLRTTLKGSIRGIVTSLAFAPDGKSLSVCDYGQLSLIDAATGKTTRVLKRTTR